MRAVPPTFVFCNNLIYHDKKPAISGLLVVVRYELIRRKKRKTRPREMWPLQPTLQGKQ